MTAIQDLLEDATLNMNTIDEKHKGYLITYQELQSIQFLYVNYQILSEEFDQMQEKKIEFLQYKLNYEENKKKWDIKIAVAAGDAQDRMKALIEDATKNENNIKELEITNSRLSKENKVYKDYLIKE